MDVHARTDPGRERETNEDAVLAERIDGGWLLAVADGMGGHAAGDVASEAATTVLAESVRETGADDPAETRLREAVSAAAERVRSLAEGERSGMGTTLVAALVYGGEATIVNVGDSRAYRFDGGLRQVTVDHSLVQQLLDSGEITPEEARTHPQRNVVTQALGTDGEISPDVYREGLPGTLLLCSDGLTEELTDGEIESILAAEPSAEAAAAALVGAANDSGGRDNVSVVVATA
jgi:protein phosphatase